MTGSTIVTESQLTAETGIPTEESPGIEETVMCGISDVSTETSTLIFLPDLDDVMFDEDKLLVRSLFASDVFAVSAMKEPKILEKSNWMLLSASSKFLASLEGIGCDVRASCMQLLERRLLSFRARQRVRVTSI